MSQDGEERNFRSKTLHLDDLNHSKSISQSAKKAEILKLQSQIRRMKNLISMEIDLRKDREQLQKVNSSILNFQSQLKQKRKDLINQQITLIQQRRWDREQQNKLSNKTLAKLKQQNKSRRDRMQSIISQYKQQYDRFYHKKLSQRRQMMKVNFQEIKSHQSDYLKNVKRRRSIRIRTQNCQYSDRRRCQIEPQYIHSGKIQVGNSFELEQKRHKLLQIVKKRKQYGEQVQKQARRIKISADIINRVKEDKTKQQYKANIDNYNRQKIRMKKPRLDTNFEGDIQVQKNIEIKKIAKEHSPTKQKLTRLQNLANGYTVKYQNGDEQALDKMCNLSLLRAKLLLDDC